MEESTIVLYAKAAFPVPPPAMPARLVLVRLLQLNSPASLSLSPSRVPSFFDPIQAVRVSVFSRLRDSDKTGFNVEQMHENMRNNELQWLNSII